MPKARLHLLSAPQVDRLTSTGEDQMYSDGGGLYLFVREYGAKEWVFRYTSPLTNSRRKQSLGAYPDTSLKQARMLASAKREMLSKGSDPIVETEKQLRLDIKDLAEQAEKQKNSVRAVFQVWKNAELQNRKDKGKEIERAFEKDVFPAIGNKPIGEVVRSDVKIILDRPLKRSSRRMANRLLSDLKQFFGYAQDEELINHDPTRRMVKERVGGKEKPRKRYLNEKEIKLLNKLLPVSGLTLDSQHLIWLILATGCRVYEILRIKWIHVDWKRKVLHIPAEHAKNTDEHEISLSAFALKQLRALQKTKTSVWLVPNPSGEGPVTRQVLTKQVTDRQQEPDRNGRLLNNARSLVLPGGHWVIHDLRRSASTIMQELGVLPYIIKKCLNQRTGDKIVETYQRALLIKEQSEAFKKLGAYLESVCKYK